jgi:hypothetical protein
MHQPIKSSSVVNQQFSASKFFGTGSIFCEWATKKKKQKVKKKKKN